MDAHGQGSPTCAMAHLTLSQTLVGVTRASKFDRENKKTNQKCKKYARRIGIADT